MCGVFGIRSEERDVARLAYFGLFALQHRGQESAGIAVSDRGRLTVLREMGLVAQVFDVRLAACEEVVDADHLVARVQEPVAEVRAQEARPPGHQHAFRSEVLH